MYDGIVNLQKTLSDKEISITEAQQKIIQTEEQLRKEEKKRLAMEKKFEVVNRTIESFDQQSIAVREQYCRLEADNQKLRRQVIQLIEKKREVEKERTMYYRELKKMSRVSFGQEQPAGSSEIKASRVIDQRWKQIEANLKKLQQQNELISSNLQVKR